jgi:uncharacterized protein YpmS
MNHSTYHHKQTHMPIHDWRWIILLLIAVLTMLAFTMKAASRLVEPSMTNPVQINSID